MPPKRKEILLTEFVVEVYPDRVDWDQLDRFLLALLRRRPEGGYARAVREARYRRAKTVQP